MKGLTDLLDGVQVLAVKSRMEDDPLALRRLLPSVALCGRYSKPSARSSGHRIKIAFMKDNIMRPDIFRLQAGFSFAFLLLVTLSFGQRGFSAPSQAAQAQDQYYYC